ncbi:MAG: membrane lipoprotein lipid attachment site-containing protein [Bacteroidales bacterium]|nr:membrane lipoprotein lipid attachment site-containing protein [Bacteroidales bacterium]
MKKILFILAAVLVLTACSNKEAKLLERAAELCKYIPDHELLEQSRDYMTEDFYSVLDTMFNLPNHEALDHEWLYYFVTGNGGSIADYEVVGVEQTDPTHSVATINVRQKWEDGSFDPESDIEEHKLYMEKVGGRWLMSDFDGHKADCVRYIAINHEEQAVRRAISNYLVSNIGEHYMKGNLCVPTLMIVSETDEMDSRCALESEGDSTASLYFVWGDFWVFWYNEVGDTLKCVSGGNHSGLMSLERVASGYNVTSFEQTVDGAGNQASAKRIFGEHYDIYCNMHSNEEVREAVRREQLAEYVKGRNLPFRYYQDYGRPAVEL